jgi:hypothetical protein
MPKQKPNPSNSPIIQALLDMGECGFDTKDLLKQVESNKADLAKANQLFDNHQYPNRALKYAQLKNFDECRALLNLCTLKGGYSAIVVFVMITQIIRGQNTFQLSSKGFMEITKMSNKTIAQSLKLLKEQGFIAVKSKAVARYPAIYMVNPNVVNVGKPKNSDEFEKLVKLEDPELTPLKNFIALNSLNDTIGMADISYKQNDVLHKCATLLEVYDKEKGLSVATTDKPQNDNLPF